MALSNKLSGGLVDLACQEAEPHDRSISNQITHWMSIGRAIERSGICDHSRIVSLLERQDRQDAA